MVAVAGQRTPDPTRSTFQRVQWSVKPIESDEPLKAARSLAFLHLDRFQQRNCVAVQNWSKSGGTR